MNVLYQITIYFSLITSVAHASAADSTTRKPVDPTNPFAKLTGQVTQMASSDNGYGNGFIVGSNGCHVLTNFHVAFGRRTNSTTGITEMVDDISIGHIVNFAFDVDTGTGKFRQARKAKVIFFGNYEQGTPRGFLNDLALLRLESCLGPEFGHLEVDRPPREKRVATNLLMTVSSSRNSAGKNEVLVETGCRPLTGTSVTGSMLSNCEVAGGMSGSMLLEEGDDKKWRLAGVTTARGAIVNSKELNRSIYASAINKFLLQSSWNGQ